MSDYAVELELEVRVSDAGYLIEARSGVGGECAVETTFAPGDLLLEQRIQRLRIALLSSAARTRRLSSTDERSAQQLGTDLFGKLFVGDVRVLFDTTRQQAAQRDLPVRLVLRIRPPELAALPWEFMYDERRDDYLSLSMPLVRYPEILEQVRPLRVSPPLRILGMSSVVHGFDPLDVAAEKAHLHRALSGLSQQRRVELSWVSGETWRDLVHKLNSEKWHVLHLIGHGGFDETAGEGVIYLAAEDGGTYRLKASRLAQVVNLHPSLRLIILNSCESAVASSTDLFSSSAATLIRRGVPAVLAMQFEISDDAAIEFTSSFYDRIAYGQPIDVAVRDARLAVSLARPNSLEWGTPVLFLRQNDGRVFDVASLPSQRPVSPPATPVPPALTGRARSTARPVDPPSIAPSPDDLERSGEPTFARHGDPVPRRARVTRRSGRKGLRRLLAGGRTVMISTVAVALVLLTVAVTVAMSRRPNVGTTTVTVAANRPWTDSGIRLRSGQFYSITVTGQISSAGVSNGPEGLPGRVDDPMATLPEAAFGELIAQIGGTAVFAVGSSTSGRATSDGELLLGPNDLSTDDNTGEFTAQVILSD